MKLKNSILIVALMSLLAIGLGVPVLAAGDRPSTVAERGVVRGIVTAVSGDTIQIGNTSAAVVKETIYRVPGTRAATLADIRAGMLVVIQTAKAGDRWYASSVSVMPISQHFVGKVTSFSYDTATGGHISIQDKQSKAYSFVINAGRFTVQPNAESAKTGDHVTVVTQRILNEDEPIAIGAVVSIPLEHYSGKISDYRYDQTAGGSISILDKAGKTLTFIIMGGKFSVQPKGVTVKTGDQVTVVVQLLPEQSQAVAVGLSVVRPLQHFVGKVTAFNYDAARGGNMAIQDKDGKTLRFDIEAGKFSVQPGDDVVKLDETVTVVARTEGGRTPVAVGVVIHPTSAPAKSTVSK